MTIQEELSKYRTNIESKYSKPVRYRRMKPRTFWTLETILLIGVTMLINLLFMLAM